MSQSPARARLLIGELIFSSFFFSLPSSRHQVKFPSMSSYNRMLIHRCAAYFGMDHNVDTSQTSVIVAVTKSTRIPEVGGPQSPCQQLSNLPCIVSPLSAYACLSGRISSSPAQILFDTLIRETMLDEPRKSILKRDAHSFDECRQSLLPNPDRGLLDRKAKSFEEREEEYEKARRRIFKGRELVGYHQRAGIEGMQQQQDENSWPWSSTESSDNSMKIKAQNNRLLKVHSLVSCCSCRDSTERVWRFHGNESWCNSWRFCLYAPHTVRGHAT